MPLIDAGVSVKTDFAIKAGMDMDVFVKKDGRPYIGKVWPGYVHFVDFLHPNATNFWSQMLKHLYDKVKFSGIWLDMNEVSDFDGNRPTR